MLREIELRTLILALDQARPVVLNRITANMSVRAASMVRNDMAVVRAVDPWERERAQKTVCEIVTRLADAGRIMLPARRRAGQ